MPYLQTININTNNFQRYDASGDPHKVIGGVFFIFYCTTERINVKINREKLH